MAALAIFPAIFCFTLELRMLVYIEIAMAPPVERNDPAILFMTTWMMRAYPWDQR